MKKVLSLDIGGTNSRIALINIAGNKPVIKKKITKPTDKIRNISAMINSFEKGVENACIGFAGPITGNKAKLTNANLSIDLSHLKKETGLKKVVLINDFHANGHAIPFLKKSDIIKLNSFSNNTHKVKMVVGPGTGLGKAHVISDEVYPCEAGWTSLGIENIDDYALFDYLKRKYNRQAYYEDVLSGRGLIDIYDHLEIKSNMEVNMKIRNLIKAEPVHKAKVLIRYSNKDPLCDMTLRIFTKFYARFIRDSCLNLLTSEVYLVGGITKAIRKYLEDLFMHEYLEHSEYRSILKRVSINLVLNEDIGLLGSGTVAAKL